MSKNREKSQIQSKIEKDAKTKLSMHTLQIYKLNKSHKSLVEIPNVAFNLNSEIKTLKGVDISRNKLTKQAIVNFAFSGKFTSVIGVEGIKNFSLDLYNYLNSLQDESDLLKVDKKLLEEMTLKNGICYEYEFSDETLKEIDDKYEYRALFRLLLINEICIYELKDLISLKSRINPMLLGSYQNNDLIVLKKSVNQISNNLFEDLNKFINKEVLSSNEIMTTKAC